MPSYKAPLRDMRFIAHELWNISELQKLPFYQHIDFDLIDPIMEEAAKIAENILQPLNQSGDAEGCRFQNGEVQTPRGFKEAYQQFVSDGWMALNADPEYGGQGLPKMLQVFLDEMLASSNVSFSLYTVLTQGASQALLLHASDELKQKFLPNLISGKWSGTMCLTESHSGTDLGLLRTKAVLQSDGSYKLTGSKIFITSGEHDLAENIIHAVLARLPDASPGIKGISMFLVPKFLVNQDNSLGERNTVTCGSIEHKMGIRASATCVLNFEEATGYLVGNENEGMKAMFSMMNLERLNIGLEGLGLAEVAYQNALIYAKERLQGRATKGAIYPDKLADPIIVHADVRRMLLTIKAYNEGARALAAWVSVQIDLAKHHPECNVRLRADNVVSFLTPVIKAFFTDYGFDACNLALQVFGGHGYVREWGMEQFVRDIRIAQIYEGTNGVQAMDLVKRKLTLNNGEYINQFVEIIGDFIKQRTDNAVLREFINPLQEALNILVTTSYWLITHAEQNSDDMGAGAMEYLHLVGHVALAYIWAEMISKALEKKGTEEHGFYCAKIKTGRFFYKKILPKITALSQAIQSGSDVVMDLKPEEF
jgi:butyryl-CoA dehydrogenase